MLFLPKNVNFFLTLTLAFNRKMKRSPLAIAFILPALLLTSCTKENFLSLNPPPEEAASAQSPQKVAAAQAPSSASPSNLPAENLQKARQLAWDAAVLVQRAPHPPDTWQTSKIKRRQAIRLLEEIPPHSAEFAWAEHHLPSYRANFEAISERHTIEQTAKDNLAQAQALAWQAAVTVQTPPHSLKVWHRAYDKWTEAIAALDGIPRYTWVASQAQERLATYRDNQAKIAQRIRIETQVEASASHFATIASRFKALQLSVVNGQTSEPLGITYEDYSKLVQDLRKTLAGLDKQPGANQHPAYGKLIATIADYEFALNLWQSYLDYKRANASWLHDDDFFNQLLPLSRISDTTLLQKYSIKIYQGSREPKIPLKFALWEIWETAGRKTETVQQEIASLK
jgi:hypothetical protein